MTTIGDYAFRYCEDLTSVEIPDSVTTIGYYAFSYCNKLETVIYNGTKQEWEAIEISSGNQPLLNATLQFGFPTVITKTACSYSTGALVAELTFEHVKQDSVGYLAIYDANHKLMEVGSTEINAGVTSAKIIIPTYTNYVGYSYQIMVWDAKTLIPQTTAVSGIVNASNKQEISLQNASCYFDNNIVIAELEFDHVNVNCTAYLAIYEDNHKLAALGSSLVKIGENVATITIPSNTNYQGYQYKIMIWNPGNLYPYTTLTEGTVQN